MRQPWRKLRVRVLSLDFVLPLRYEGVSSLWG